MTYDEVHQRLRRYRKRKTLYSALQRTEEFSTAADDLKAEIESTAAIISRSMTYLSDIEQTMLIEHYVRGKSWQVLRYKYDYSRDGLMSMRRRFIVKIVRYENAHLCTLLN